MPMQMYTVRVCHTVRVSVFQKPILHDCAAQHLYEESCLLSGEPQIQIFFLA
jgi:hypothetical protein